ncbi:MAG: ABC transporter ATP-binding protein [Candidatus Sumerlaeaceae bacterium]
MTSEQPLIEVNDVTVERDFTTILQSFSWCAYAGQHWVIFGPNGAGKTSLLNVIQGYLWPTSGTVRVLGGELGNGVDVRELRRWIPVVSEPVRDMINESLTGLEVLVTGARAHLNLFEAPSRAELSRARSLARQTQIELLLARPFAVMSTGERQRILITRALMPHPKVIILDEPCAGLDLAGREWVLNTIETAARQKNPPVLLLTTHHVEEVTPSFTHALLIKAGEIYAAGPIDQVFTSKCVSGLFDIRVRLGHVKGRYHISTCG